MDRPRTRIVLLLLSLVASSAWAAPRQHTIVFGKRSSVHATTESGGEHQPAVRVRELLIDGHLREYTAGPAHEITDRLFVIRKAQRLNDTLPEEAGQKQRWVWRLDGWISVDRQTGHITQLNLPAFDPEISEANWYRDYAAYCGSSDDGAKIYLVVVQLGKRKPLLKKELGATAPACSAPKWERNPSRVTFNVGGEKSSFVVRWRAADQQSESNTEEEGPQ